MRERFELPLIFFTPFLPYPFLYYKSASRCARLANVFHTVSHLPGIKMTYW